MLKLRSQHVGILQYQACCRCQSIISAASFSKP